MRIAVGGSLMWRQRQYTVLFIERDSATLRDDDGGEVEVAVDELGRDATPMLSDTSGLQRRPLQVEDIEPGMDPWLQVCIRIEGSRDKVGVGKAVETERQWLEMRLGKPVSTRAVERRLKEFRARGRPTQVIVHHARASGIRASSRPSTSSWKGRVAPRP